MRPALSGPCAAAALCGLLVLSGAASAAAPAQEGGRATKLPLPRYASLKTDRVNLREGPSKDHRTLWVFRRAGLPVEIVAEFENWRRIRDSEGTEGWVLHSLLSGRRTAVVTAAAPVPRAAEGKAAESKAAAGKAAGGTTGETPTTVPLYARAEPASGEEAKLEPGVIGSVKTCTAGWCRIVVALPQSRSDVDGYIRQDRLWGVYPNETLD